MIDRRIRMATVVGCVLLTGLALRSDPTDPEIRKRNLATVQTLYDEKLATDAGNAELLIKPGVVADRRAHVVTVMAEATGLDGRETAEFFLIGPASGHGYESVACALASAFDIRRAMEFVGMTAGRPVDFQALRFWPKGERTMVTVRAFDPEGGATPAGVAVEDLIFDANTDKPLDRDGLVFTGSSWTRPDTTNAADFAADCREPRAIASNYNEPGAVFDIPRKAPQGAVYNSQTINPAHVFPAGQLLEFRFAPEYTNGNLRVVDLELSVTPARTAADGADAKAAPVMGLGDLSFNVGAAKPAPAGAARWPTAPSGPLTNFLDGVTRLVDAGHDPFVHLSFDKHLTAGALSELCLVLASIESERGIRMEPPPRGELYYLAFRPDERFRDRAQRPVQPWELRLEVKDGKPAAKLVRIKQTWKEDSLEPDLKVDVFPLERPPDLKRMLEQLGPGLPVILVFTDPAVTYGRILEYLSPVLDTHGTIHVYVE